MIKETIKSYFAGLTDGEGYIGICRSSSKYLNLRIGIGNTKKEPLKLAQSIWGGGLYLRKDGYYFWDIKGKKAEIFLKDIQKYSILKKEHIKIALKFRNQTSRRNCGRKMTSKILELKNKFKQELCNLNANMGFALRDNNS